MKNKSTNISSLTSCVFLFASRLLITMAIFIALLIFVIDINTMKNVYATAYSAVSVGVISGLVYTLNSVKSPRSTKVWFGTWVLVCLLALAVVNGVGIDQFVEASVISRLFGSMSVIFSLTSALYVVENMFSSNISKLADNMPQSDLLFSYAVSSWGNKRTGLMEAECRAIAFVAGMGVNEGKGREAMSNSLHMLNEQRWFKGLATVFCFYISLYTFSTKPKISKRGISLDNLLVSVKKLTGRDYNSLLESDVIKMFKNKVSLL